MENGLLKIKLAVVGVCGAVTAAFGWLGWMVIAWVACMLLDWITGSCAAAKKGEWSSSKARAGIWHKAGMICVVLVAAILDGVIGMLVANTAIPVPYNAVACPLVLAWYIITELGSVLENSVNLGAKVPKFLEKALEKAKAAAEKAAVETIDK